MLDRSKIYCMGCEELPTILTEIRDKKLIEVRDDLLQVCTKTTYQIAQGTKCANDIMRYSADSIRPGAFNNKGFTCVDPYTFAFTWLGYIPESLRVSAKSKVFCTGCDKLKPVLDRIRRDEGNDPFSDRVSKDSYNEFSQASSRTTLGYSIGPYFGEKFGRVEVSPEVFAAIWLGTGTTTDNYVDETAYLDTVPSEPIGIEVTTDFQIKL